MLKWSIAALVVLGASACAHPMGSQDARGGHVHAVPALAETPPVGVTGDAADDPAIWIAPTATESRVIGTQKKGGYYVYDMEGRVVQELLLGRPNNVDIAIGFPWSDGVAPIVAASDRADNTLPLFRFDTASGRLEIAPRARVQTGFAEVYGACIARRGDDTVLVATSKIGEVAVWLLKPSGAGVTAEKIGAFALGSIAEGCVIDGAQNAFFVAQELRGLWRIGLDDPSGARRTLVDTVGSGGHLAADVEGVSLWEGEGGAGYLVVSVQGRSRFNVYERSGAHRYRGAFRIVAGAGGDAVSGTDGIAVSSFAAGARYPQGLFVAQDDVNSNPDATQNFKYASWADVMTALELE